MLRCLAFFLVLLSPLTQAYAVSAQQPRAELSAEEIAKVAFSRTLMGVGKGTADMRMNIVSAEGNKKERKVRFKTMRTPEGLMRYLIKFDSPAEIKGTSFLVRERKGQLPDQYVYAPALKATRRIPAGNASSSFFGTDFIYADLLPYPTDKKSEVELKKLPDQVLRGQSVYVVEISPKAAESPYGKLKSYIQKDKLVSVQIEFFDRSGALIKTMRVNKFKDVEGQLTPVGIEMKTAAGGKTELFIENINPKAPLSEDDFTESAMTR